MNNTIQFEKDIESLRDMVLNETYAQALYAALCNVQWKNNETDKIYSCSWRYAGGLVANLKDDYSDISYMKYYCSGIDSNVVSEGDITGYILQDLYDLGWSPIPHKGE
jgi:hypothetical protein